MLLLKCVGVHDPRRKPEINGMPQITHCPVFDCHNLTVWVEHRDHCMEQKDPAGSTESLPGLFTVLNDLWVMSFGVRLWENYFSSGSLNFLNHLTDMVRMMPTSIRLF